MAKLPKFEEYVAPWEKGLADGETPEVDLPKLKKFVYDVLAGAERDVTAAKTERDTVKTERDEAKRKLDEKNREGESETDRLKREVEELKNKKPEVDETEVLKLRVALAKGLNEFQTKRLVGTTKEELEADADEILANFAAKQNGEEEETGGTGIRSTPKVKLRNPGSDSDDAGFDPDKAADDYFAQRGVLG